MVGWGTMKEEVVMTRRLVWTVAVLAGLAAGMAWGDLPAEPLEGTVERTANGVRCHGDAPGEWSHDWEAVTAAAKAEGGAVFVNFTGSDWCGWCKLMDRLVFSTDEWKEWAKGSGVHFAWVDFPEDVSLLPDKETQERNEKLSRQYKVEGFPTYFLLDAEGTEVGQFGASRDATPEKFIAELEGALEAVRLGVAWKDAETGWLFPKSLGGMKYAGRTDYGERGLGYSLRYDGAEGEWADVYVYDGGEEDIGEGATAAAKGEAEQHLQFMHRRELRGELEDVRMPEAGTVVKIGGVRYFTAGAQYTETRRVPVKEVDSTVAVTGRAGLFVKVRYSRPRGEGFMEAKGMTETLKALLRDLSAVISAAPETPAAEETAGE